MKKNLKIKNEPEKKQGISHLDLYKQSFKWNSSFAMTVLLDFGYFITIIAGLLCFFFVLQVVLTPAAFAMQSIIALFMTMPSSGEMSTVAAKTLEQNFLTLQWFYLKGIILAISTVSLAFIITSLYKASAWLHMSEQKHTGKYVRRFLLTSIVWQLVWLIVAVITFLVFTAQFAAFFLILELSLYLYCTPFIRMLFTEKHGFWEIYKEAIVTAVQKFKHFIIPCILMCITILFTLWIFLIIAGIFPILLLLIGPLFIFLAMTWTRFYFSVVAKKFFQKH